MNLKRTLLFIFLFFSTFPLFAQNNFRLVDTRKDAVSLPFSLVNNMIVIKAKINGKELSFILDTGIKKTLLFNLKIADSLTLKNIQKLQLRGLGEGNPINAMRSNANLFQMNGVVNPALSLYVITDNLFDLSSKMGIDVHGIIGGDLFNDFIVKISYTNKRLTLYDPDKYVYKRCKNCETFPLDFYNSKPYIDVIVENHLEKEVKVKLLIDSGGGDSLWLFPHSNPDIIVSDKYFDDFLGKGLNGNIYGKRSKINKLKIGGFEFENAAVSYPDSTSIVLVHANKDRNGTLGAGILKRFNVIMDYPNSQITLKKNASLFREPFLYNKSGIELMFGGEMLVKEKRALVAEVNDNHTRSITDIIYSYGLSYKPSFQVSEIRKGSPAHLAGVLEGDILLEINGVAAYSLKMEEVIHILSQKENKKIRVLVDRKGRHLKYQFILRNLL